MSGDNMKIYMYTSFIRQKRQQTKKTGFFRSENWFEISVTCIEWSKIFSDFLV